MPGFPQLPGASDGLILLAVMVLIGGGLIWVPAAVVLARGRSEPVARLTATPGGPPAGTIVTRVVPAKVRAGLPFGTNLPAGVVQYELTVPERGVISFAAPMGLKLEAGDDIAIALDPVTRRLVAVSSAAYGATWQIPPRVPGPLHPLAPMATLVGAVGVPLAAIGAGVVVMSEMLSNTASSFHEFAESMGASDESMRQSVVATRQSAMDLSSSAAPLIVVPGLLMLGAILLLCRRPPVDLPKPSFEGRQAA